MRLLAGALAATARLAAPVAASASPSRPPGDPAPQAAAALAAAVPASPNSATDANKAVTIEIARTAWLEHYQPAGGVRGGALQGARSPTRRGTRQGQQRPVTPAAKGPPYRFTASGNGSGNTSPFTIPATTKQWQLARSYNCASFGTSSDFSVDINRGAGNGATDQDFNDNGPDTQGQGGNGVDTFYGTGTFDFQVWANCNWNLGVIK